MNDHDQTRSQETARWLQKRERPGNWFDIADTDIIPIEIEGSFRTILHMFQIAFAPEIRRRRSAGQLDDNFFLAAVQLIQPEEGEPMVRLNGEVRGTALARVTRAVNKGDPVFLSDMRHLEGFDLEEDELDAGHFTLFWNGEGWFASFDFRAGRAKSTEILRLASEFLETAEYAADKGHAGACVDNLFSACELASKARLRLHRNPAAKTRTHGHVHSAINKWGHLGNVDEGFLKLFNRMVKARPAARYSGAAQVEMPSESDLRIVRREIERLKEAVAQRTKSAEENPK